MVSSERILECLTFAGNKPLKYCFLMGGRIHYWDPDSGFVMEVLSHDDELSQACRVFLQSKGAEYRSHWDVAVAARQQKWQNWERLQVG
jgi:hypothetical protein